MKFILITLSLLLVQSASAQLVERPPQFVLMAFDGSYSLSMWQETLDLAKQEPFRFTYFISGPYFLLDQNKTAYSEPTHGPGKSAIGWGGNSVPNLIKRVDSVNRAFDEGHEIASHANGHFDGSTWSLPQWNSEMNQFYHLIFNIYKINSIPSPVADNPFHFDAKEVIGFRAPLLGQNAAMYETLNDFDYAYDTSQTAPPNYWPRIKNNLWNFPLAELRIAGSGKKTLSMDYNFYYTQSKGLPDPKNYKVYKTEMLNTYLNYFKANYYGNRAPVNIGHHFSKWNDGAYWDALKEFSAEVCGLPEVRCVTYRELHNFVKTLDEATIASFQRGDFTKFPAHKMPARLRTTPPALAIDLALPGSATGNRLTVETLDPHQILKRSARIFIWSVNGNQIFQSAGATIPMSAIQAQARPSDNLSVALVVENKEIQKTSRKVLAISEAGLQLGAEDLELESLKGDLPGAHGHEPL